MRLSRLAQTLAVVALTASPLGGAVVSAQEATPAASTDASPIAGTGACTAIPAATPVAYADVDPTTLDLDVLYIDAIVPYHEAAIFIAREAQARSTRTEVVSLAAAIAERRVAELEQLRTWRAEWYPDVPPLTEAQRFAGLEAKLASPGAGGVAGLADLTAATVEHIVADVCDEAADIDLSFIDATVELSSGATQLSDLAATQALDADLGAFAGALRQSLEDERAQLLSWRDAWYGGVPSGDHHADGPSGTPAP